MPPDPQQDSYARSLLPQSPTNVPMTFAMVNGQLVPMDQGTDPSTAAVPLSTSRDDVEPSRLGALVAELLHGNGGSKSTAPLTPPTQTAQPPLAPPPAAPPADPDYGFGFRYNSQDPKGLGYFGNLQRPDGTGFMGEYSIDEGQGEIPSMVPGLTHDELQHILGMHEGDPMPPEIRQKAIAHALQRKAAGLPVFARPGEQQTDLYPDLARAPVPTPRPQAPPMMPSHTPVQPPQLQPPQQPTQPPLAVSHPQAQAQDNTMGATLHRAWDAIAPAMPSVRDAVDAAATVGHAASSAYQHVPAPVRDYVSSLFKRDPQVQQTVDFFKQQTSLPKTGNPVLDTMAALPTLPLHLATDQVADATTVGGAALAALPAFKLTGVRGLRAGERLLTEEQAAEHLSRAPIELAGDRLLVSPRMIETEGKNFRPADPGRILVPDLAAAQQDPEYFAKIADMARQSPLIKPHEARWSDLDVANQWADRGAGNVGAVYRMSTPAVRTRGGLWYPGGRNISDAMTDAAAVSRKAGPGVLARLSPSMEWDMNIDNAQRLARWRKVFMQTDQAFTREHFNEYLTTTLAQEEQWILDEGLTGQELADYKAKVLRKIDRARSWVGMPWSELPYEQRAQLIRAHSQMHEAQTFARYAPEGHIVMPVATRADGEPWPVKWQTYDNLGRALAMMDDPSDATISYLLGKGPKIRSFHNNISDPTDPRSLTADVHNVAGTNLRPLGASQAEVKAVTRKTPGSAPTGLSGTYPLYHAATTRAAADLGMVPNRAQSIPWETTRGLFSPSQRKSEEIRAMANQIWSDFQRGKITQHAAQTRIHNLVGGVQPPAWASYPAPPK